jgi:predicted RNase H-like HicB family nuclease
MNKLFYPALFHTAEEGGFWISFPDFPDCLTQGETMNEAYDMAVDALGLCITDLLKEKLPLPEPSSPKDVILDPDALLLVIGFNLEEYRRKHNSKAVKKTLTIPEWLNEEAQALNINFSAVLQEALIQKIQNN